MGVREVIWAIVALLFGYVLFQLYRVFRIGRTAATEQGGAGAGASAARPVQPGEIRPAVLAVPANSAAPAPSSDAFQAELELRQLRRDVARLQEEVTGQRGELSEMAAAMRALKEEFDAKLASQSVSPEYNEALVFARRGLDVDAIAERCGISVAEAELVRALAQRGGDTEPGSGA